MCFNVDRKNIIIYNQGIDSGISDNNFTTYQSDGKWKYFKFIRSIFKYEDLFELVRNEYYETEPGKS